MCSLKGIFILLNTEECYTICNLSHGTIKYTSDKSYKYVKNRKHNSEPFIL